LPVLSVPRIQKLTDYISRFMQVVAALALLASAYLLSTGVFRSPILSPVLAVLFLAVGFTVGRWWGILVAVIACMFCVSVYASSGYFTAGEVMYVRNRESPAGILYFAIVAASLVTAIGVAVHKLLVRVFIRRGTFPLRYPLVQIGLAPYLTLILLGLIVLYAQFQVRWERFEARRAAYMAASATVPTPNPLLNRPSLPRGTLSPGEPWDSVGEGARTEEDVRAFSAFPLFWLGENFAGYNLTAIGGDERTVTFRYGSCTQSFQGVRCAAPVLVIVGTNCWHGLSSLPAAFPAGRRWSFVAALSASN
jgi:hypothetical protein